MSSYKPLTKNEWITKFAKLNNKQYPLCHCNGEGCENIHDRKMIPCKYYFMYGSCHRKICQFYHEEKLEMYFKNLPEEFCLSRALISLNEKVNKFPCTRKMCNLDHGNAQIRSYIDVAKKQTIVEKSQTIVEKSQTIVEKPQINIENPIESKLIPKIEQMQLPMQSPMQSPMQHFQPHLLSTQQFSSVIPIQYAVIPQYQLMMMENELTDLRLKCKLLNDIVVSIYGSSITRM